MPDNPALSSFHAAIAQSLQSSARGPINEAALLRDKDLALQKAASLHGYQTYLTQCRKWKAAHKRVPPAMEREVQLHATQAMADGRDLATATLRMTRHLKQAGHLDRILDSWIAGVKASGPVQVQDLWTSLANDTGAQQLRRDQGFTDELFAAIDEQMRKLDGQIALRGGKLAGELKLAGQERTQHIVLRHSASGRPRTLHDLLSRGQFERVVEQFEHGDGPAFDLVAGPSRELELTDLISAGAISSVQGLAQHKRKLEDTGLATYAGADAGTLFIIAVILVVVGSVWSLAVCNPDDPSGPSGQCAIAAIFFIAGLALGLSVKPDPNQLLTSTPTLRVKFEQNRVQVVSVQE